MRVRGVILSGPLFSRRQCTRAAHKRNGDFRLVLFYPFFPLSLFHPGRRCFERRIPRNTIIIILLLCAAVHNDENRTREWNVMKSIRSRSFRRVQDVKFPENRLAE